MEDEKNPMYMFQITHTSLLCEAVKGNLDLNLIARIELANRGLNADGAWVGFEQAKKELDI